MDAVEAIVDRAISDPDFVRRLMSDPIAALQAEGIDLSGMSPEEALAMRRAAGRSWQGLVEVLEQRISRMGITGTALGPPGTIGR